MYGTSPELLNRMYVPASLQNRDEGFSFQVKNLIDSGSISGALKIAVDGEERPLEGATIQVGNKTRALTEITWSSSIYLSYGDTATVYVPGPLEPGEHTIDLRVNVAEIGGLTFSFTDKMS